MKKLIFSLLLLSGGMTYADGYTKSGTRYLYAHDSNNVITCQVQQLCDITLLPGDLFSNWIFTDAAAWQASASQKTMYTDNNGNIHIVIQAVINSTNNNTILVGANNQYHFVLNAVSSSSINNYAFIDRPGNDNNAIIDQGISIESNIKRNYNYTLSGDTYADFKPVEVFNDGKKMYIRMPSDIDTRSLPTPGFYDKNGKIHKISNFAYRKPYFIVYRLYNKIALTLGNPETDSDATRINVKYDDPNCGFVCWLSQDYAD